MSFLFKKAHDGIIVLIFLALFGGEAFAHRVMIVAWSEGDFIVGETKFDSGPPPKLAEIIVEDKTSAKVILTLKTDINGKFRFQIPDQVVENRPTLRLIVRAGPGHQAEWLLQPEDYLNMSADPVVSPQVDNHEPFTATITAREDDLSHIDAAMLQKIIEDVMDKRLAPLKKMMREEQGPQLTEIVAGIGYIFGFFGMLAYWKSRKKK